MGTAREEPSSAVISRSFLFTLADYSIPEPSFAGVVKQEEEPCVEEEGATEDAEFTELSVGEF